MNEPELIKELGPDTTQFVGFLIFLSLVIVIGPYFCSTKDQREDNDKHFHNRK